MPFFCHNNGINLFAKLFLSDGKILHIGSVTAEDAIRLETDRPFFGWTSPNEILCSYEHEQPNRQYGFLPVFWSMPMMILSESAAAATVGLISSLGQLGGFAGPYVVGFLNDRTHSLTASFGFIALVYVAAASLILGVKIRDPLQTSEVLKPD